MLALSLSLSLARSQSVFLWGGSAGWWPHFPPSLRGKLRTGTDRTAGSTIGTTAQSVYVHIPMARKEGHAEFVSSQTATLPSPPSHPDRVSLASPDRRGRLIFARLIKLYRD